MMKLYIIFSLLCRVLQGLNAQQDSTVDKWGLSSPYSFMDPTFISQKTGCPVFQLQCPKCPLGSECVYPNINGCPGAGVPFCRKKVGCEGVKCLSSQGRCPKECPLFCNFDKKQCCPFDKKPVCSPPCNTFVACKVTACPKECPDDCFYPDADYCCPKSGKTICRKQ